ncbi:sensor histidine kinase [Microbacterium telephonicum]|uniref:histidine kinase n=1 Tax=Microbacterium telephonicum TaxID=1714841 RepID=A0A498C4A7_9MICO|nr:HAMP domain-containing sensor histidine kinase [Microbacterium telephonicum]RLK47391.1 two-component system OmpR family sensor kinase [Microbacterium telephonicum]
MTVGVLAVGLVAAGVGTMVFLRNAQIVALDDYLSQLAPTDVASTLMTVTVVDGVPQFESDESAPATQYFVAVYGPDGTFLAAAGGNAAVEPDFPDSFTLDKTYMRLGSTFDLHAVEGGATFHAAVDFLPPIDGVVDNQYTQMVALPLTSVNQTVATYIGIYTILALLTILGGALLTRGAVTLAFRSLGQVERTAMSIAAGDFTQRMGDISPGTEVGRLTHAINAMLDRVDQALAQRDATVQQMRRFIGDASHELRTPLVTVRGYAELYRMGAISGEEQTAQSMERIEKEAVRMGALVEDLLALARLDERRDIAVTEIDLRPIGRDAAMDMGVTAPDRTIRFVDESMLTVLPPVTGALPVTSPTKTARRRPGSGSLAGATRSLLRRRPRPDSDASGASDRQTGADADTTTGAVPTGAFPVPIVLGDEHRIRQVVANLLANARRYTPPGSPLEIAVGVDETAAMGWIAVVDHGEGIPPQIREKIFQRFWRADTSRTRETGGSGLGLSIVASIVDSLHGSIAVTETAGGGATFRVAFPLAEARDPQEHLWIATQPLPKIRPEA